MTRSPHNEHPTDRPRPAPTRDPETRPADQLTRRLFFQRGARLTAGVTLGAGAVSLGDSARPATADQSTEQEQDPTEPIPGKDNLRVLNDRPLNAETPAHLLDDEVTPASRLFVRNNGFPPITDGIDPSTWTLQVDGESCSRPQSFTIDELRERFEIVTLQLTIECAGNGRSEFRPAASGNQWTVGAVGCPSWTGIRVRDLLEACGVAEDAVYLAYEGADIHLSGDPAKRPISRGVPIEKALEPESLVAFQMNGEALPSLHGFPLRLVTGGWPASTCGKWLTRLSIRDRVHDGTKMKAPSYRMPRFSVAPGTEVPDEDMVIIGSMPVKSLITSPRSGISHPLGEPLSVRGHAWAHFSPELRFESPGDVEVWARATDTEGRTQPMVLPGWNPKGYLNNACHRIALQIVG